MVILQMCKICVYDFPLIVYTMETNSIWSLAKTFILHQFNKQVSRHWTKEHEREGCTRTSPFYCLIVPNDVRMLCQNKIDQISPLWCKSIQIGRDVLWNTAFNSHAMFSALNRLHTACILFWIPKKQSFLLTMVSY